MGVKLFAFGRRREGVSVEDFHRRWREEHARSLADEPTLRRHVRRFELNHRLPEDYQRDAMPDAERGWDGVAVLWFDSLEELAALQAEPAFGAHAVDADEYREPEMLTVLTHDPEVIVDTGRRDEAGAKMVCILRHNQALDLETYHEHWLRHHGGLFQEIPELRDPLLGYDQNHGLDLPDAEFDGVTEQWFESFGTFVESLGVEAVARDVNPDVAYFLDPTSIAFIMAGPPTVAIGD